jgi:3-deoxy-D-manno-octulosonic-acid transferase
VNAGLGTGYRLAGGLVAGAAVAASLLPGDAKWQRAVRGRRGVLARYRAWAAAHRDATRPMLWMHAPSVGEGLQARPVLELLRRERPGLQIAYTHYSPSAEPLAHAFIERGLVDFADYLPWDTIAASRTALAALRPTALVFAKLDVWPMLAREASARGVALGLVSATLGARSARRSWWGRALLGDTYARLDAVGAIDADDAERLAALGVRRSALGVTGDTRYDQVWARAARPEQPVADTLAGTLGRRRGPWIVAGSTWPPDERIVLEAWRSVRATMPDLRVIVAPHEPTEDHLRGIERWAAAHDIPMARLGAQGVTTPDPDLVLVDRVGVLGDLYGVADMAYVGGGFHPAGLHSVLEPAAFGVPVLFGPRYGASRDATRLLAAGGARVIHGVPSCAASLTAWMADGEVRRLAGDRAREVVRDGLGAAERSVGLVLGLLDPSSIVVRP